MELWLETGKRKSTLLGTSDAGGWVTCKECLWVDLLAGHGYQETGGFLVGPTYADSLHR